MVYTGINVISHSLKQVLSVRRLEDLCTVSTSAVSCRVIWNYGRRVLRGRTFFRHPNLKGVMSHGTDETTTLVMLSMIRWQKHESKLSTDYQVSLSLVSCYTL